MDTYQNLAFRGLGDLRTLDLFSGIGGWSLGLPAGFHVVAAVEAESWKRAIHRAAWPGVPVFRDIRKVMGDAVRRSVGPIDCIVGSPPCQDASAANPRGRGIDGPDTGLFREAVRLVRELRPSWVALENSPRLRSRGIDRVLGWLEEAGYAVWPLVVGAEDLGAPHERKRVWIIAHAANARAGHGELVGTSGCSGSAANGANAASLGRPPEGRGRREDHLGGRSDPARDGADADTHGLWIEPRRVSGANGQGEAVPAVDAGHTNSEGQPFGERFGRNLGSQLAASERTAWLLEHPWAGGLVRHLRVVDGLSAGIPAARLADCRSAYGDAVVPAVVGVIGRAILAAERCLTT